METHVPNNQTVIQIFSTRITSKEYTWIVKDLVQLEFTIIVFYPSFFQIDNLTIVFESAS